MTIREKLLVKIAQDATFEGTDETEKALVKELKAEMSGTAPASASEKDFDIKGAAQEMAKEVAATIKTIIDEQKKSIETVERKDVSDMEINGKKISEMDKKERFAEYVKSLVQKDFGRTKALSEGSDPNGGYLVPQDFRAELIEWINSADTLRQYATVIPMTGNYLEIPKLTADVSVTWGTENQSISTTSADFGNMVLTPFRMNAIIYTSRELFEDSAIAIFDVLQRRFRDRVKDEENKVFLNGNGTTQPKGLNQETFRSISAANALTPDHLTKAYWKLPAAYRMTSRWIINPRVMEHLENSKDSYGQYLYPSLQGEVKTLKGRPLLVLDQQPSSKLTLGDLSFYYIGDRQQMTMETTTEAGDTWKKHQVGLKLVERVDGECAMTQAFVQVTNTNIH